MNETVYEPIEENSNQPATKADVERILTAIESLWEQINNQ